MFILTSYDTSGVNILDTSDGVTEYISYSTDLSSLDILGLTKDNDLEYEVYISFFTQDSGLLYFDGWGIYRDIDTNFSQVIKFQEEFKDLEMIFPHLRELNRRRYDGNTINRVVRYKYLSRIDNLRFLVYDITNGETLSFTLLSYLPYYLQDGYLIEGANIGTNFLMINGDRYTIVSELKNYISRSTFGVSFVGDYNIPSYNIKENILDDKEFRECIPFVNDSIKTITNSEIQFNSGTKIELNENNIDGFSSIVPTNFTDEILSAKKNLDLRKSKYLLLHGEKGYNKLVEESDKVAFRGFNCDSKISDKCEPDKECMSFYRFPTGEYIMVHKFDYFINGFFSFRLTRAGNVWYDINESRFRFTQGKEVKAFVSDGKQLSRALKSYENLNKENGNTVLPRAYALESIIPLSIAGLEYTSDNKYNILVACAVKDFESLGKQIWGSFGESVIIVPLSNLGCPLYRNNNLYCLDCLYQSVYFTQEVFDNLVSPYDFDGNFEITGYKDVDNKKVRRKILLDEYLAELRTNLRGLKNILVEGD